MCVLITKNKKSPLVLFLGEEELKKMQQQRRHRNDHLVDVVIAYNNAACIQMEKCNYERSVKLFATAAAVYKRVLFHRRRRLGRSYNNNKNVAIEESSSVVVSVDSFMRRKNAVVQATNNATTGACYQHQAAETAAGVRAYTRPIQIPSISSVVLDDNDAQSCLEEGDELSGCFSSILQFNLALAYHLLGIQCQRRDLLRRAISTYESSFRFERLRHCNNNKKNKDGPSSFVSYFLLAAIINNLGHVYRFTKQQNQTERHFRKLIVLLTHLVRIKRVRRTDEEYSMFFRNCAIGLSRQEGHILGACAA